MIRWFASRKVRHATAMCRHVRKILNHQRDILLAKDIDEMEAAVRDVRNAVATRADNATLDKHLENLEKIAGKRLKPYPSAAWRENVEVLLVALTVAMGIRTFFLQPFKIPTGSMQPTLYGVVSVPDFYPRPNTNPEEQARLRDALVIPTGWERVKEWFKGVSYLNIVADQDGVYGGADNPVRILIFSIYQKYTFAGKTRGVWFPPDYGSLTLDVRAGLRNGQFFRKGENIVKMRVQSGDHLFVDRLTYNFRRPKRGEIIVFRTRGIESLPQGEFYIKRLVALPGERVRVGNDRHLVIDGRRLDWQDPHFMNVYSFNPKEPPRDSFYSGHVNQKVSDMYGPTGQNYMRQFPDESAEYRVGEGQYLVMGDNTMNSLDSRYWGSFASTNVIGRSFFVYWPLTERFGWSCLTE